LIRAGILGGAPLSSAPSSGPTPGLSET